MKTSRSSLIYQFKIVLKNTQPAIWRRIQVPEHYTFWDLHVALQDSMGWLDYHLHEFEIHVPRRKKAVEIGIPDEDIDDHIILPGWRVPMRRYFKNPGDLALYRYDFGDGWEHELLLEGILLRDEGVKYPRCIAGERACPPEDCGSIPGYYELLEILRDPNHEQHQDMIAWLRSHAKNYYPYDPNAFDPERVHFDDPKKRFRIAFSEN